MLNFIVAFAAEANPLIEYFCLQKTRKTIFDHYISTDGSVSLTCSGIGKINAGAAVVAVAHDRPWKNQIWINIGIAGHANYDIGEGVIIGKLQDGGNGRVWYPQFVFSPPLKIADLITLEQPSKSYKDCVFDMEASGFYALASRLSTHEFVHCIKIISDNILQPVENVSAKFACQLIEENMHKIESFITSLRALQNSIYKHKESSFFYDLIKEKHFTVTQKCQLKNLLHRWDVLEIAKSPFTVVDAKDQAKEVIKKIKYNLDKYTIDYDIKKTN